MTKKKPDGSEKFETYYSSIYKDSWETLKANLLTDSQPVLLSNQLTSEYYLDRASIEAASHLPVKAGDSVLDMCAAPGGKSLVLALKLKGTGSLKCNDRSSARRSRLHKVIKECLPLEYSQNIQITAYDSTKWNLFEKDAYDCILLDAPCSSERHVLKDPQALSDWGTNRPKVLSIQQFAMLASALDAVKTGGYILYSTCSINPLENEENIEKLYKKREGRFEEIPLETKAEKLSHGYIYLPSESSPSGPLYFCLLRRIS